MIMRPGDISIKMSQSITLGMKTKGPEEKRSQEMVMYGGQMEELTISHQLRESIAQYEHLL